MSPQAEPLLEQALRLQHKVAEIDTSGVPGSLWAAVSEREILRLAILLANDCTDFEKLEVAAFTAAGGPLTRGLPPAEIAKRWEQMPGMKARFRRAWEGLQPHRDWMRSAIELVMDNPEAARIKLRRQIEDAVRDILVSPSIKWDGRTLTTELRYFALTVPALAGYAIALLLDDTRKLAGALRRCALKECGRIFLSAPSGKGGRPPLYCTRGHQAIAAANTGAERTEKWRAKTRRAKR